MTEQGYHNTRVLVLGASGFIGAWVARGLCGAGAQVYVSARDARRARSVLSRFGVHGEFAEVDVRDERAVERLLRDVQPTVTFNLAGYGVDPTERDERTAYAVNATLVDTLCHAISAVRDRNWPGLDLVHVGSALEYGAVGGILAEDTPPRPTTDYGRSKLEGTRRLANACANLGLKGITARLFTVYGPGEHDGRLLPSLLEAAGNHAPLKLTHGRQKRDFTYVEDVVEGLLRLGRATPKPGEIVNLATGRLTSVREFAELAADIIHIPPGNLEFGAIPTRVEEMEHAEVRVGRLRQLVGWIPSESLATGIRKTVEFQLNASSTAS